MKTVDIEGAKNLLLDTHVLIWWISGSERPGKRARHAMFRRDRTLWVSAGLCLENGDQVRPRQVRAYSVPTLDASA